MADAKFIIAITGEALIDGQGQEWPLKVDSAFFHVGKL